MIRWATISLLAGLLAIGVLYDRSSPQVAIETVPLATEIISPMVSRPGQLTSVWYCPVGSSSTNGYAGHEIAITNTGDDRAVANLTVITDNGPSIVLRQEVQPSSTSVVDLPSLGSDAVASALVEIVGGEGLVGHTVQTEFGPATGACATDAADNWLFAAGSTTRDANYYLVLMNPFGEDAVFDAEFRTESRTRRPIALQSDVVKGRSTKVIDITEHVSRAETVSAEINVTVGRLVAERLQTFDGVLGPKGAALSLGVSTPQSDWFFPAGRILEDSGHRLVVYNPGETPAEVDVSFMFDDPEDPVAVGLVPIELTIAAGRFEFIDVQDLAVGLGLELPLDVGMAVNTADESAVVAERWQLNPGPGAAANAGPASNALVVNPSEEPDASGELDGAASATEAPDNNSFALQQDPEPDPDDPEGNQEEHEDVPLEEVEELPEGYVQPSATTGIAISRGVSQLANNWLIPRTELFSNNGTAVVISSIEGASVEVELLVGGELQPPIRATVPAGGRVVIPVGTSTSAAPIVVTATAPVAVEVQLVVRGSQIDTVPGVPVTIR